MMRFSSPEDRAEIKQVFDKLTLRDVWTLIKWAKHIRGRCRNNAALCNYLNSMHPEYSFSIIQKQTASGVPYKGMHIMHNHTGEKLEGDNENGETE